MSINTSIVFLIWTRSNEAILAICVPPGDVLNKYEKTKVDRYLLYWARYYVGQTAENGYHGSERY